MKIQAIKKYEEKIKSTLEGSASIVGGASRELHKILDERKIGGKENIRLKTSLPWVIPTALFYAAFDNPQGHGFLESELPTKKLSGITFYENLPTKPLVKGDRTTSLKGFHHWFDSSAGSSEADLAINEIFSDYKLQKKWITKQEEAVPSPPNKKRRIDDSLPSRDVWTNLKKLRFGKMPISEDQNTDSYFTKQLHKLEVLSRKDDIDFFEFPTEAQVNLFTEQKDVISIKPSEHINEFIDTLNMICDNVEKRIQDINTENLGNIFTLLRNDNKAFQYKKFLSTAKIEFIKKFEEVVFSKLVEVVNYVFKNEYNLEPTEPTCNNGLLIQDRRDKVIQEWHEDEAGDVSVVFALRSQNPTCFIPNDKRNLVIDSEGKIDSEQCNQYQETRRGLNEFLIFCQRNASCHLGEGYEGLVHASPNDNNNFRFVFSVDLINAARK